jgi:hypothetical protein
MWEDPIVSEVRKVGEELARMADGDVHTFFSNLKSAQARYKERLTRLGMNDKPLHEKPEPSEPSL